MKRKVGIVVIFLIVALVMVRCATNAKLPSATVINDEVIIDAVSHEAGIPVDAIGDSGRLALGIASNGDYAPLQMDQNGWLIFKCAKGACPNKFCKELHCQFNVIIGYGYMDANCKCAEKK